MHQQRVEVGRVAAARHAHGGDRKRHIRPVLAGRLGDLGAAHQLDRGLAVLGAGIETGIVNRHPARVAHRIGHPQGGLGSCGGGKLDPYLEMARRFGAAIGFEARQFAVDVALLACGVADRAVGGCDFIRHRRERRAPLADRARLALLADPDRRGLGEVLGEFAPRLGRADDPLQILALIPQRLDPLVDVGQVGRRHQVRRSRIDGADRQLGAGIALDPQRGRIEPHREILRDERVVSGRQVQRDDAGDARAIGIDRHSIDLRGRIEIGRMQRPGNQRTDQHQAGGHKTIRNPSHHIPPGRHRIARDERRAKREGAPFLTVRRSEEETGSIEVSVRRDHGAVAAAGWRSGVRGIALPS